LLSLEIVEVLDINIKLGSFKAESFQSKICIFEKRNFKKHGTDNKYKRPETG
jgi:hypothetical protein